MRSSRHDAGSSAGPPAVSPQAVGLLLLTTLILLVFVVAALGLRGGGPAEPLEPILLATGDWAPYSGETLPEAGVASAVVAAVFQRMGYAPQLRFMPWPRVERVAAEEDTSRGVRGAFPYARTTERERAFYYSRPIFEITLAAFFDASRHPDAGRIQRAGDLARYRVVPVGGYRYPREVEGHLADIPPLESSLAAFRLLLRSDDPLLVVEAERVAEELLREPLAAQADRVGSAPLRFHTPIHLIASRRNPENLALVREFDATLAALQDDGSLEPLQGRVLAAIDARRMVRLQPPDAEGRIFAYESADGRASFLLPRGTQAVVERWSRGFLEAEERAALTPQRVKVRLLNGPQRGRSLYVDERAIVLP